MSERAPHHEQDHSAENNGYELNERQKHQQEALKAHVERAPDKVEDISHLLKTIEQEARSAEDIEAAGRHDTDRGRAHGTVHHARTHSAKQNLSYARKHLSSGERAFSKVVHNPTVEAVSSAAETTVARPSGLLLGGIFSVLGSVGVLIVCRYYGYEYNFSIGLLFFVGGFALGIIVEILYRTLRPR